MTRSPTLKTLWIGSQAGVWKTSPRKPSEGAVGRRGVRELGGVLRDAGGRDGVGVGGHDAAVGEDGGEVQRAAGRDHQQAGDVAVDDEEGAEQQVAGEVDLLTEAAGAAGQDRDDQDLDHERGHGEP